MKSASLSHKLSALGIRGKLIGLVVALAAISAVCLGVAVNGLMNARTKSQQSESTFGIFQQERNAYEGWLTDDDQSNMYAAVVALHDPHQRALAETTWQPRFQFLQSQARFQLKSTIGYRLSAVGNRPLTSVSAATKGSPLCSGR